MTRQELDENTDATREAGMPVRKQKGRALRARRTAPRWFIRPGDIPPLRYLKGIADVATKTRRTPLCNSAWSRSKSARHRHRGDGRRIAGFGRHVVVASNAPVKHLFDCTASRRRIGLT